MLDAPLPVRRPATPAGSGGTAGSPAAAAAASDANGTRCAVGHPARVAAGRVADDVRRVRADEPDARALPRPRARSGRGPRRRGSGACCPVRRASTGRSWPSLRTTRWHGTTSGTGLWASAVPTARTAFGLADLGGDPAVRPDLAPRDLERLAPDRDLERRRARGGRARSSTRRSPARRRSIARASFAGSASAGEIGAPDGGRGTGPRTSRRRRPARPTTRRGRSRPRRSAPSGESSRHSGRPGRPRRAHRAATRRRSASTRRPRRGASRSGSVNWRGHRSTSANGRERAWRPRQRRPASPDGLGAAIGSSSARSCAEAARDVGLDRALGPAERLGDLGDAQAVDVAEHDRGAERRRELEQERRPARAASRGGSATACRVGACRRSRGSKPASVSGSSELGGCRSA